MIRLYETLLGRAGFRRGMDLYFERFDGQAVTCDDFRNAMADANDAVTVAAAASDPRCLRMLVGIPARRRTFWNAMTFDMSLGGANPAPAQRDAPVQFVGFRAQGKWF